MWVIFWWVVDDVYYVFYYIIYVSEVVYYIVVVEYFDRFVFEYGFCEEEKCYIWLALGAIYGEEVKFGCGYVK